MPILNMVNQGGLIMEFFMYLYLNFFECKIVKINNISKYELVRMDYKARNAASKTCKKTYNKCLLVFYKYDFQAYRAICGNGKQVEVSVEQL